MKRWWLAVYAPGMLLGCVGMATWWVGYAAGSALWLLPGLVLAIAVSWLAERCWPYDPAFNARQGDAGRDAVHALVNEGLNLLAIGAIPLVAAWVPWQLWPTHWSVVAQVVLAIVAADLGITLVHYASHRWAWLWRLHAVHHSVTRMYGFNGLMKHPLHQTAEALGGVLPLLLLGMPYPVAAVLAFAIAIQLLLQHSNVDMRPGWLGKVMAWAPLHRFHHMRYGKAGDVNFGLFLTVWDHLLGTAFDADYRMRVDDLGIGSQPAYPRDYLGQLLAPFRALPHVPEPPPPPGLDQSPR
ncbi:sterol desaturase family protein [Stenotrophomonas rhizophila]|uniref:sterol desaturase family protein n=1 Tax=Stenotrophomonas rhizophila TaxID=216778 RepID=UPI002A6B84CE|nr:sterol desaturase family protein [Stenotrophomonas rhizophila]MDY0956468.1 sterol desaturase family protein [Stenotrophomonas rhizophila]